MNFCLYTALHWPDRFFQADVTVGLNPVLGNGVDFCMKTVVCSETSMSSRGKVEEKTLNLYELFQLKTEVYLKPISFPSPARTAVSCACSMGVLPANRKEIDKEFSIIKN